MFSSQCSLEFDLLQAQVPGFSKSMEKVMEGLVRRSTVEYAIIQASSKGDHLETLIVAYAGENWLRDLIAGPSIVGLGFPSREEAMAEQIGRAHV